MRHCQITKRPPNNWRSEVRKMTLEERVGKLEKRLAELETVIQAQPKGKFIPEDSSGKHCNNKEKMTFEKYCNRCNR